MSRPKNWAIIAGIAALACVPLVTQGVLYLWKHDPFARYFGNWSDPFGGNIGSQMTDVDIQVFNSADKTLTFHADRVDVRRDRQFMQLVGLTNGHLYDKGKPVSQFGAGSADVTVRDERVRIAGGAWLQGKDFRFETTAFDLSEKDHSLYAPDGVKGTYKKGALSAKTLLVGFGGKPSKATHVSWSGPIEVQGQGTRKLLVRADLTEFLSNPDREIYTNAEAIDQDAMMRARKLTWDKEADIITMEGDCEYQGPEAILTGPRIVVYRKEKRAVVTDNVRIVVKPEKEKGMPTLPPAQPVLPPGLAQPQDIDNDLRSGKTLRKYPVVITCTKVEYFYAKAKKRAIMTGSPKARQELRAGSWREITAPTAIYEEEKELLTLKSGEGGRDVRLKNSAGDDLVAESLAISTVEGKERMTGVKVEGSMRVKEDEGVPPPRPSRG